MRAPATRTIKVIVRHSADCPDKRKGTEWRRCHCPKSLFVYEGGGSGKNRRISCKTRSWEQAEKFAQAYLDSFDSEKQELKRLRAEKQRKQVLLEDAVALYNRRHDRPAWRWWDSHDGALSTWEYRPRNESDQEERAPFRLA